LADHGNQNPIATTLAATYSIMAVPSLEVNSVRDRHHPGGISYPDCCVATARRGGDNPSATPSQDATYSARQNEITKVPQRRRTRLKRQAQYVQGCRGRVCMNNRRRIPLDQGAQCNRSDKKPECLDSLLRKRRATVDRLEQWT